MQWKNTCRIKWAAYKANAFTNRIFQSLRHPEQTAANASCHATGESDFYVKFLEYLPYITGAYGYYQMIAFPKIS